MLNPDVNEVPPKKKKDFWAGWTHPFSSTRNSAREATLSRFQPVLEQEEEEEVLEARRSNPCLQERKAFLAFPTSNALLIDFLLSCDAEIFVKNHWLSMQLGAKLAKNVYATCTCSDWASISSCRRCWLGCNSRNGRRSRGPPLVKNASADCDFGRGGGGGEGGGGGGGGAGGRGRRTCFVDPTNSVMQSKTLLFLETRTRPTNNVPLINSNRARLEFEIWILNLKSLIMSLTTWPSRFLTGPDIGRVEVKEE